MCRPVFVAKRANTWQTPTTRTSRVRRALEVGLSLGIHRHVGLSLGIHRHVLAVGNVCSSVFGGALLPWAVGFACTTLTTVPRPELVSSASLTSIVSLYSLSATLARAGANCPNRGPPIFATAAVSSSLAISGDMTPRQALDALAKSLGIDPALIQQSDNAGTGRRAVQEISFSILADPNEIDALFTALEDPSLANSMAAALADMGINATVTPVHEYVAYTDG